MDDPNWFFLVLFLMLWLGILLGKWEDKRNDDNASEDWLQGFADAE